MRPRAALVADARDAHVRAITEAAMPSRATIQQGSHAATAGGGQTTIWTTTATDRPCRLTQRDTRPEQTVIAERAAGRVVWTIALGADETVTDKHRILIGARTFEVLGVDRDADYAAELRCICAEVT